MQAIRTSTKNNSKTKSTQKLAFNAQEFLDSAGVARKVAEFKRKETIFAQGDQGKNVLYIQKGGVRLSVVNERGKEAVVARAGARRFFRRGMPRGSAASNRNGDGDYSDHGPRD
jgi:CRP-like cAMP-binding protein